MEAILCEPVELTAPEIEAVAGGSMITAGPMTVSLNINVAAGNGVADGVADGVGNIVWGNATIGIGNGNHNGGTTLA